MVEISLASGGYPREFFTELATLEDAHFWFRARDRLFRWAIRRHHPQARSMLEVGCGTGHVLSELRVELPELRLVGSELFHEGLWQARERVGGSVDLVLADARRLPFGADFDVVGAFDVLEHIEEDGRVVAELHRVLRPGGMLLLTVPQHRWLWSEADDRAQHVRRYSRSTLHPLLEQAGFEILRSTSFVSLLLPVMVASRLRRRGPSDPLAELRLANWLNTVLGWVMTTERAAIQRGITFPWGGSRLVIARRGSRPRGKFQAHRPAPSGGRG